MVPVAWTQPVLAGSSKRNINGEYITHLGRSLPLSQRLWKGDNSVSHLQVLQSSRRSWH
jgi:hypothetical protein